MLMGGAGRDLLIGGFGSDRIMGDAGDDIEIAGSTVYDGNLAALSRIMAEWTSGHTYSERVANLQNGSGDDLGSLDRRHHGDYRERIAPSDRDPRNRLCPGRR